MERHREQTYRHGPGFSEDKYDFKYRRTSHLCPESSPRRALDFVLIRRISGSNLGPDFGEGDNPSRDVFKTKADVVKFVQEAVADGAKVIQQQGEAVWTIQRNFSAPDGPQLLHLDVRHRAQR